MRIVQATELHEIRTTDARLFERRALAFDPSGWNGGGDGGLPPHFEAAIAAARQMGSDTRYDLDSEATTLTVYLGRPVQSRFGPAQLYVLTTDAGLWMLGAERQGGRKGAGTPMRRTLQQLLGEAPKYLQNWEIDGDSSNAVLRFLDLTLSYH